jgi:hypothetical protein
MTRPAGLILLVLAGLVPALPATGQTAGADRKPAAATGSENCRPQPECRTGLTTLLPGAGQGVATRGIVRPPGQHSGGPAAIRPQEGRGATRAPAP